MLRVGIVGLPNVGKSTLFNAVTRTHKAEAANYPFCTIEPNVGCVEVPDERLAILARLVHTEKIVPAAIEFVDIAGIVKDAYKGEGLGNQFLANIRETDAIIQVVRCFENDDIVHTMGKVDPIRDIDVINTELLLADVQSVEKQVDTWAKKAKSNDKTAVATHRLLQRLYAHLNDGKPASTFDVNEEEAIWMKSFGLLTRKPVISFSKSVRSGGKRKSHVRFRCFLRQKQFACLRVRDFGATGSGIVRTLPRRRTCVFGIFEFKGERRRHAHSFGVQIARVGILLYRRAAGSARMDVQARNESSRVCGHHSHGLSARFYQGGSYLVRRFCCRRRLCRCARKGKTAPGRQRLFVPRRRYCAV